MFLSIVDFLMDLSLLYLLTAVFILIDLLLLSLRARRHREEKELVSEREMRRERDAAEQRRAFEQRQGFLKAAP